MMEPPKRLSLASLKSWLPWLCQMAPKTAPMMMEIAMPAAVPIHTNFFMWSNPHLLQ
jgi:hypothetical protein